MEESKSSDWSIINILSGLFSPKIAKIETVIMNKDIPRIIALSDIHSDIHAFIICLRDCAKVIRKISHPDRTMISHPDILDKDTEILLEMDLNIQEKDYINDLNYEWIGGKTHVVICGDMLDGARQNETMKRKECGANFYTNLEYDQVEIKLLRFINAINKLAMKAGGRIYKILGNHEFINLNNEPNIEKYIPKCTLNQPNYHMRLTRRNYFNAVDPIKNSRTPGYELLFEDGVYICLIINNNIFVHGQLDHSKTIKDYETINNEINDKNNDNTIWGTLSNELNNKTSFGRDYSRTDYLFKKNILLEKQGYDKITLQNLLKKNGSYSHIFQNKKCIDVKKNLEKLKRELGIGEDLRVIVGHCPQMIRDEPRIEPIINSSFKNIRYEGNIEILEGPQVFTGLQKPNLLFGIGMECNKRTLDSFDKTIFNDGIKFNAGQDYEDVDQRYIYKVDVGSTRGFDYSLNGLPKLSPHNPLEYDINKINIDIASRSPQVLEIIGNNIRIIRSTVPNTRIHQPRFEFEKDISSSIYDSNRKYAELIHKKHHPDEFLPAAFRKHYNKYLKYKQKYIKLKKLLS